MPEKKLNVFLHFRKAGGTRMVNLALANGESLWDNHDNGKPCDSSGTVIDLTKLTIEQSLNFIEDAISMGKSFISVARGKSFIEAAIRHPQVRTICSLRDPKKTCLSNYNYDYYLAEAHDRNLSDYIQRKQYSNPFTKSILHVGGDDDVKQNSVGKAVSVLQNFDVLIELGHPDSDRLISQHLGWNNFDVKSHSTQAEDRLWKVVNMIKKGRLIRAVTLILGRKRGTLEEVPEATIHLDQELMNRLFKPG